MTSRQGAPAQPRLPLATLPQSAPTVQNAATRPVAVPPPNAWQPPAQAMNTGPQSRPSTAQSAPPQRAVSAPAAILHDFDPRPPVDWSGRLIVPNLTIGQLRAAVASRYAPQFVDSFMMLYDPDRFVGVQRIVRELDEDVPKILMYLCEFAIIMHLQAVVPDCEDLVAEWCRYLGPYAPRIEALRMHAQMVWTLVKKLGLGVLLPLATYYGLFPWMPFRDMDLPKVFGMKRFMMGVLRKAAKKSRFRGKGYDEALDQIGGEEVRVMVSERMYGRIDQFYAGFVEIAVREEVKEDAWTTEVIGDQARFVRW